MKICTKCKQRKEETEFYKDKSSNDGLTYWCKNCRKAFDKTRSASYYLEHKEDTQQYRKNNKEGIREYQRNWCKGIKGRTAHATVRHKVRAEMVGITSVSTLTPEDVEFLYYIQRGSCVSCGTDISNNNFQIEHIIPISKGGDLSLENCQLLCKKCNLKKRTKDTDYLGRFMMKKAFGITGSRFS